MVRTSIFTILTITVYADFFWGRCPSTTVVQNFDEERYLGKWMEIARTKVPYSTTDKCNRAFYYRTEDDYIGVVNSALEDYGFRNVHAKAYCE